MMNKCLICLILLAVLLTSCNMPEKVTTEMLETIAAETLQAQINFIISQTPPTPTPTNTPLPTDTPTITPTPTIAATPTWTFHEAGSANVLILYYHDVVNNKKEDPYYQWEFEYRYVKSIEFEQQVRILSEMNYTSITLSDLVKVLYEGGELPERPVMFTFDSSELGQWVNAYPILKKYGMVGNLMLESGHVDAKASLSSKQINKMLKDGWEIGCAGDEGNGLTTTTMGREIGQGKIKLEQLFDVSVQVFAYPDGYTGPNGEFLQRVVQYGYKAAFAGNLRSTEISRDNVFFIPRYEIQRGMTYNEFFSILPWKEGSISRETMEWTLPTPTIDPAVLEVTKSAQETMIAAEAQQP